MQPSRHLHPTRAWVPLNHTSLPTLVQLDMRHGQNIGTKRRPALAPWVDWEIPNHDPVVSMAIARQTVGALRL